MYDDDEMNDQGMNDDALDAARSELPVLPVPPPPPVQEIVARGRALRYRRRAQVAGTGAMAVAVTLAIAIPSIGGGTANPGRTAGLGSGHAKVDLAAFSVDSKPNGTVTVSWRNARAKFNPAALSQALARAGVPALVKDGTFCSGSVGQVHVYRLKSGDQVFAAQPTGALTPQQKRASALARAIVIKRGAIPARSQISIGYLRGNITAVGVVPSGATLSCSHTLPVDCKVLGPQGVLSPTPSGTVTASTGTTATGASTLPTATLPASTLPASTLPASTLPATTLPATTLPATTSGSSPATTI